MLTKTAIGNYFSSFIRMFAGNDADACWSGLFSICQRPELVNSVLEHYMSTPRLRRGGLLWFKAISSASIFTPHPQPALNSAAFPLKVQPPFSACLPASVSASDTLMFSSSNASLGPLFRLSSKVRRGGIKWLSEDVAWKGPGQPMNDKTLERDQRSVVLRKKQTYEFSALMEVWLYCADWYLKLSLQN